MTHLCFTDFGIICTTVALFRTNVPTAVITGTSLWATMTLFSGLMFRQQLSPAQVSGPQWLCFQDQCSNCSHHQHKSLGHNDFVFRTNVPTAVITGTSLWATMTLFSGLMFRLQLSPAQVSGPQWLCFQDQCSNCSHHQHKSLGHNDFVFRTNVPTAVITGTSLWATMTLFSGLMFRLQLSPAQVSGPQWLCFQDQCSNCSHHQHKSLGHNDFVFRTNVPTAVITGTSLWATMTLFSGPMFRLQLSPAQVSGPQWLCFQDQCSDCSCHWHKSLGHNDFVFRTNVPTAVLTRISLWTTMTLFSGPMFRLQLSPA